MARKKTLSKDAPLERLLDSDSDDENYSESAEVKSSPRKPRAKKTKGRKGHSKPARKKARYDSEEDDDISEVTVDSEPSSSDEEPVAVGASGRPLRRAVAKNQTTYAEDESDEDIDSDASERESEEDGDGEEEETGEKKERGTRNKPSRMVTLKFQNKTITKFEDDMQRKEAKEAQTQPLPTRRSTRATSSGPQHAQTQRTTGGKGPLKSAGKTPMKTRGRGASAEPTRRSTRRTATEEPMVQLSDSGHHVVPTQTNVITSGIPEERESQLSQPKQEEPEERKSGPQEIPDSNPPTQEAVHHAEARENTPPAQQEQAEAQPQAEDNGAQEQQAEEQPVQQPASRDDTGHEADEDDEDMPTRRTRAKTAASRRDTTTSPRATRPNADPGSAEKPKEEEPPKGPLGRRGLRRTASRKADSEEDEYQEEEDAASSDDSMSSGARARKNMEEEDDSDAPATRSRGKRPAAGKRRYTTDDDDAETQQELAEELEDLRTSKRPRRTTRRQASGNESTGGVAEHRLRRRTNNVDYRVFRPEMAAVLDDPDAGGASTPNRRRGNALAPSKSLFDTNGPFGGTETIPIFGRPGAQPIDFDSDSSDDEAIRRRASRAGLGGGVGMTPSGAHSSGMLPPVAQTHNVDPLQAGAPANLGRITKPGKNAMADADPLGVSTDISFDSVGGLDDRIQQLKEMVMLPLMYPEMFKAKGVTPPRGVLFHGPPGTGKTLMARAVASSFTGADGKRVTFYMRKGADCLSKWVGEAERQLRLLFEEARNTQPSIIFFDEIDGLAPVRSSKQEQIHASIVSTLLALMDGMDGRGQVVVIGATNRPDAVDPALRRPGRFDREFYFPLPATEARRKIIDIHTKGWEPPLTDAFKDQLAAQTKGYGGADLRALCTEAALNAMQRTYPQIYKSDAKLKVDPTKVTVTAKDFMMSIKKLVPSSERSASSGAAPLPEHIKPLLHEEFDMVKDSIRTIFPEVKRLTPLEEAEYEDDEDAEDGFNKEMMMENFESARVYRPRLLIHGSQGLGQQYMGAAILHYLEKVHVQAFDLATLMSDATRTPETAVVQLFTEVKRHKPSVIYIPNVDIWYHTLPATAIATFKGLLNTISPNERIMVFGIAETRAEDLDSEMLRDLFGYSRRDRFELHKPQDSARYKFFKPVMDNIRRSPREFPQDPTNRRKRKLPELERASPPPQHVITEEEKRAQALRDRQLKNHLKLRLNNLMENLKTKYRRFKKPVIDQDVLIKLLEPPVQQEDTDMVVSDIPPQEPQRWSAWQDEEGVVHVKDNHTGKQYYNMDLDVIEDRFSNGYYSTPRQFLDDLQRIRHDAKALGEKENKRKANEMLTNAEVYIAEVEADTAFVAQCEEMHQRLLRQAQEDKEAAKKAEAERAQRQLFNTSTESNGNYHTAPGTTPERSSGQLSNGVHHPPGSLTPQANSITPQASAHFSQTNFQTPGGEIVNTSTQMTQMESANNTQLGLAKVSAMSMSMIVNDASTTTSGKRTSDGTGASQPFSLPYSNPASHPSNNSNPATIDIPPWHELPAKGDSQLPATQVLNSSTTDTTTSPAQPFSQQNQQYSQFPPPPPVVPAPNLFPLPAPPTPELVCTQEVMSELHNRLTQGTSGFSVEQMEQVNAVIMDVVWKQRGSWNRDEVARRVEAVFEETRKDIVEMWGVEKEGSSFGA